MKCSTAIPTRKGISALISTVLLLLITVSMVGLFSSWAPDLIQDTTDTTTNQTQQQIDCNEADIEIISVEYLSANDNSTVIVRNTGTIDLNSIRIEAWNGNTPLNSSSSSSVKPAEIVTHNVSSTTEPTYIQAISKQCANADDRFEDIK